MEPARSGDRCWRMHMAQAKFLEIRRCAGVDQDSAPAGMMVPFRGSNTVVLETNGINMHVGTEHTGIKVEEFDGKNIARELAELEEALKKPGVDSLFREAHKPSALHLVKPRFFRITGKAIVGSPGAVVKAVPVTPVRKGQGTVSLDVLSLDVMTIKVAIRNVKARDKDGKVDYHARQICDPKAEIANMNAVWTPQANIQFELVDQSDLLVDHDDKATREELRETYGMKDVSTAAFNTRNTVYADQFREFFARRRTKGAHISFFLLHNVYSNGGNATGTMNSDYGTGLISGVHFPTTFAHEAGHYLGRTLSDGKWSGHEHLGESETRKLMKRGGSSWAVPFGMVKRARAFTGKLA